MTTKRFNSTEVNNLYLEIITEIKANVFKYMQYSVPYQPEQSRNFCMCQEKSL